MADQLSLAYLIYPGSRSHVDANVAINVEEGSHGTIDI
jgi:hypothetical protein